MTFSKREKQNILQIRKAIKVLILEDNYIIARDILEIIEAMPVEVKMVHNYEDAQSIIQWYHPDILLCDINLQTEKSGVDFVESNQEEMPAMKIIYITAHSDAKTLESVSKTKPANFLVKPFNKNQLVATISLMINVVAEVVDANSKLPDLSKKEMMVLEMISQNMSSNEIADALFISIKTVRNHRYNIKKKLQLSDQNNSLLTWAIKNFRK